MSFLTPQQALDVAMEHHRAGRLAEAETLYRQLLAMHPDNADLIHLIGLVAYETGHFPEAFDWMQRAIASHPHVARYYSNLGLLLADWQKLEESAAALETARQLEPDNAEIQYNLGNTRGRQRQWDAAITAYRTALRLRPDHVKAWLNLGLALASTGRWEEAIAVCGEALRHCPDHHAISVNLGGFLKDQGRLDEAIAAYRAALALVPDDPLTLSNLGTVLKDRGEIAEALVALRRSLALQPHAEVHSNLIFTLLFDPESTPGVLRDEERRWNAGHAAPLRELRLPHLNDRSPERRLRIGYVSADLRNHVVGRTLLPIFEAHNRQQVECVCYSSGAPDEVTARFRARAEQWRDVETVTDAELAGQIRADGIDILVDLSLHTAYHRLPVFARQPAPVQVSWLGYPGATGLETVDYRLTDRFLDPPEAADAGTSEHPFRLPDAWCCYAAPADSPNVNELPAKHAGHITFGSFNNFAKINPRVLDLWARILHAVPDSRLLLLAKAGSHQERARTFLHERGIAPERFEFLGYQPASPERSPGDYLRRYAQIDIALDPFPYNGMTTTCDALWMGVPVVALIGASSISRASFSLLSNLGLPELAAPTKEDYVQLATTLAHGQSRLVQMRATLRERMKNSPLLDAPRLARNLEAAYREMWRRWCAQPAPAS